MLQIRTADSRDYSNVRNFYYSLIDTIQMFYEDPGWTNYKLLEFII